MATSDLQFDITALDRASKVFVKLAAAAEKVEKRLDDLDGKRVSPEVDVDTRKAEAQLGKFAADARRDIEKALKALPDVEIDANATPAQQEVARLRKELVELHDQRIGIDIDAATAIGRAKAIKEQLDEIGRKSADVQVNADVAAASAALAAFSGEVDRVDGRKVKVTVDVDKSLSDSLIKVAQLGRALGALALPAAAIAAAPQLASLGAAAVTASGALYLIPAAGAAAGLAVGALALGFSNLGDALGDSPKKAAEAMAKLSDNAKDLVTTLKGLSPAWTDLRKSVQDALLDDAGKMVQQLAKSYLPVLKTNLVEVADGFNTAAQGVAKFLTAPAVVKDISGAMTNLRQSTINASGAFEPLTRAFVDILSVGAERLPELGKGLADAATKFASFIDRARESGQLGEWMDNGIQALKQLGSIAGNVGSSLMSVFKAAKDSGADFLGTLDNLTQKMADFLKSGEGQSALVSLFQDIRAGVDAATPGLEALVRAVSDVIQALGDAGVLEAAGRAFSAIAEEVAPMISSLGGLAPILAGILNTAAGLAPVLVPIAAALGAIKLASAGTDKLSAIGTSLGVIGREAKDADAKVNGLSGKLSGLKGALAGIGPVGVLSAVFAVDAATNQGISDLLNHIAGLPDAAARAKAGIGPGFWDQLFQAPAPAANDRWDVRNIGKTMSDALLDTQRQLSGFQLEPITLAIEADSTAASISATDLMNEINGSEATVNINGNEVPAGFALRQVISEINAGKGEVIIDGKPMPAQDALQSVIDTINAGAGTVEINGEAKPAGEVLRDLLNRANAPGQATVPIGGDPAQYDETLRDGVGAALATNAMIPISGDPHDFQGILNNLISGVNASSGTVTVNGNVMPAGDALNSVLQAINSGQGTVTINGEEMNVVDALRRVQGQIDATTGTVTINGSEVNAADALERTITSINAGQGTVRINGDDVPVGQVLTALGGKINAVSGTVSINGNPQPANTALATVIGLINGGAGSVTINGVTMPAQQALATVLGQVNAGSGTITVNGQSAPAQTVLQAVIAAVNAGQGTITVNGQSVPADQALGALVGRVNGSSGTLTINGRDGGVQALKDRLSQPSSSTHTIYVRQAVTRVVSTGPNDPRMVPGRATPAGGGVFGYAGGGVHGFAGGGIRASRRRGMVVPGYAPGKDTVPAVISKGESVLVPELTRLLGARRILAANAEASGGRPATMVGQLASIMDGTIPRSQSSVTGAMSQVRAAVGTPRGGAPAGGIQLGPLLGLLQQQVGQLRSLRGDVDQSLGFRELATLLQQTNSLLAAAGRSAQGSTAASRTKSDLGAW